MIYLIQDEETLNVKVGFTDGDPAKRLKDLQTGCPGRLVLLGSLPGDVAREGELHRELAEWRVGGEWFKPAPPVLKLLYAPRQAGGAGAEAPSQGPAGPSRLFRWEPNLESWVMECPRCSFDRTHTVGAFTRVGEDPLEAKVYPGTSPAGVSSWRRSALLAIFCCEQGCRFALVVQQHKGANLVTVESLPDCDLDAEPPSALPAFWPAEQERAEAALRSYKAVAAGGAAP